MKIVTDKNKLHEVTERIEYIDEGERIAAELLKTLSNTKTGIGLTANQIGINKSVFVVNVKQPLYFINPKIINKSESKVIYKESCLSIPKYIAITKRHTWIEITADNLDKPIIYGTVDKTYDNLDIDTLLDDIDLLECIAIQHEYDHTQGVLISDIDLKIKKMPLIVNNKFGRNDKVTVTKDNLFEIIKYKNIDKYINNGWKLS